VMIVPRLRRPNIAARMIAPTKGLTVMFFKSPRSPAQSIVLS
jgi:hypothetical protein